MLQCFLSNVPIISTKPREVRWFHSAAVKWGFFMRPPLEEVEGAADEASKMEEVATWRNQKRNIWCFLLIFNSYPLIAKKNQKVISFYFKGSFLRLERNFGQFLILFFSSLADFGRIQESCLGGQDEDGLLPFFWGGTGFFSWKENSFCKTGLSCLRW